MAAKLAPNLVIGVSAARRFPLLIDHWPLAALTAFSVVWLLCASLPVAFGHWLSVHWSSPSDNKDYVALVVMVISVSFAASGKEDSHK